MLLGFKKGYKKPTGEAKRRFLASEQSRLEIDGVSSSLVTEIVSASICGVCTADISVLYRILLG